LPLLTRAEVIYDKDNSRDGVSSLDVQEAYGKLYRGRVGLAFSSRNANDALHYAQLAWDLEVQRHQSETPTPVLAIAYNDLGHARACQGQWEGAMTMLTESKVIREGMPGFTRDKLFSPLYHMGMVLQCQGRFEDAETILSEAIQDRADAFGANDASSARYQAMMDCLLDVC
jgi:tetratricopeptide (TPR) repeat protein